MSHIHPPGCPAGTRITDVDADIERAGVQLVKGFATIDNVALINVEVMNPPALPSPSCELQWLVLKKQCDEEMQLVLA